MHIPVAQNEIPVGLAGRHKGKDVEQVVTDFFPLLCPMDILQRLGQNVRYLRKKKRLSQEELGFESGIHRTYTSDVERELAIPVSLRSPSLQRL